MSPFATFFLLVFAIVGLVLVLKDPSYEFAKTLRGKTMSVAKDEFVQGFTQKTSGQTCSNGCQILLYLMVDAFYLFVVLPAYTITALVQKMGYREVALVILGILAICWIQWIKTLFFRKQPKKAVVTTEDGQKVQGTLQDDKILTPNLFWLRVRQAVFALPYVYLWYLLAVALGLV